MKILVADDHALLREGLKPFLMPLARHVVLLEAWDCASLGAAVRTHSDLDLALVDLHMPGMYGAKSIAELREASPTLPIIVLSAMEAPADVEVVLRSGASGYIPKTSSSEIIVSAIKLVLAGGRYLPPLLLPTVPGAQAPVDVREPEPTWTAQPHGAERLSPRQREIVGLLAQGLSNKMIARKLGLVEGTVKSHLVQIFHVLGVRNRTSAVVAAQALRTSLPR
jgi:DNA-binding NarL/FixJ family response regulator